MSSRIFAIGMIALISTYVHAESSYHIETTVGNVHQSLIPIKAVVSVSKLHKDSKILDTCLTTNPNIVCDVNGYIPYGLNPFHSKPTTYLSSLVLMVGEQKYSLETRGMFNPYLVPLDWYEILPANSKNMLNLTETKEYLKKEFASPSDPNFPRLRAQCIDELNCVIRASFGDGCCGYYAGWTIQRGTAIRNMIFHSNSLGSMIHQNFNNFVNFELAIPVDD